MKRNFLRVCICILCLFVFAGAGIADPMNGPWDNKDKREKKSEKPGDIKGGFMMHVYQEHISGLSGGDRCPMNPSCSHYSRQSFKKHGAIKGLILTTDRLMRCGRSETHISPVVYVGGVAKTYDPVENNDLVFRPEFKIPVFSEINKMGFDLKEKDKGGLPEF